MLIFHGTDTHKKLENGQNYSQKTTRFFILDKLYQNLKFFSEKNTF